MQQSSGKNVVAKNKPKKKFDGELQYEEENGDDMDENDGVPKIIYSSRTHTQLKQVVRELKNTKYNPRIAILGSREHLCVHSEVSVMRGTQQNHACRVASKAQK